MSHRKTGKLIIQNPAGRNGLAYQLTAPRLDLGHDGRMVGETALNFVVAFQIHNLEVFDFDEGPFQMNECWEFFIIRK